MVASPEPLVGAFGGVGVVCGESATPRLISLRSRSKGGRPTGPCRAVSTTSVSASGGADDGVAGAVQRGGYGGEGGGAQRQPSAMEFSCG